MDGIALMATAMLAEKNRLDISAANLANVSTDGFRKHVARITLGAAGLTAAILSDAEQGPLRRTGRAFDLSVIGNGAFFVRDAAGRPIEGHSASFEWNALGELADDRGRTLMGTHGPLVVPASATIDARGVVHDAGAITGSLRLRPGSIVQSGFLEAANVDAVREMVDVLEAQRSFETDQKTLAAIDEARQKDVNDVVRVK
jgi:flagellar basal-body rod protein FlgF